MRLNLYIAICFLLTGCTCQKPLIANRTIVDTVKVKSETIVHDTVFVTPKAQVKTRIALADLGAKPVVKQSRNARIVIQKVNDTVFVEGDCDTLALAAKIKEHFVKEIHDKQTVQTEILKQKYIPWWAKVLCWAGGAALCFGGFKIARIFSPFKLPWG